MQVTLRTMPDHKLHVTVDYLLFGRGFKEVHEFLDSFQPLLQSNHRMLNHNIDTVRMIAENIGEEEAAAAVIHILLDEISDKVGQERAVYELMKTLFRTC